jgi:hypothetical protein
LPEKRGKEKGQNAAVGEAKRARVVRKRRMERRRGGRKRLLRRESMRMDGRVTVLRRAGPS